jgi:predicted dehydrogenase
MVPSFAVHGKNGSFLKPRGDVQEEELKIGKKPNLKTWGTEPRAKEGLLHTEAGGKIIRENMPTLQGNYYDFFEFLHESIANGAPEPVTAQDGVNVMKIIAAAIESNAAKKVISIKTELLL